MKRFLAVLILMVLCSGSALAASDPVPSNWQDAKPEALAEAGFILMMKGDYAGMAEEWFSHFDPEMVSQDKVDLAKRQYVAQMPMLGKVKRYELLTRKEFGQSVVKLKYLVITSKTPLFFTFIYFKPDDEWTAMTINFNDKVESLEN